MALIFPTPLSDFFEQLPISECSPDLGEAVEMNETGYGEILTADMGVRLWQMTVTLRSGNYDDLQRYRARINAYRQAGRTFFAHPIPGKFGRGDPTGALIQGFNPTLRLVNANMRDIALGNCRPNYRIYDGDFISFQYGSNPTRYALHQVVIPTTQGFITTQGNGNTALFEVVPPIRTGYAANAPVQLAKPHFKALIVPGSTNMGKSGSRETKGISFSIVQTLRN